MRQLITAQIMPLLEWLLAVLSMVMSLVGFVIGQQAIGMILMMVAGILWPPIGAPDWLKYMAAMIALLIIF
jgi:hypothetical protein